MLILPGFTVQVRSSAVKYGTVCPGPEKKPGTPRPDQHQLLFLEHLKMTRTVQILRVKLATTSA